MDINGNGELALSLHVLLLFSLVGWFTVNRGPHGGHSSGCTSGGGGGGRGDHVELTLL